MTEKRIPTPKKACPFTFQLGRGAPKESEPDKPGPLIVNAAPCLGPQCQEWLYDEAGPEFGNCALVISGMFTAEASSKSETLFELARQSEEQAAKAASVGNAALAQFRTVLEGALTKLIETVERLSEIVEEGDEGEIEGETTERPYNPGKGK